jgi:hypothetical protein
MAFLREKPEDLDFPDSGAEKTRFVHEIASNSEIG